MKDTLRDGCSRQAGNNRNETKLRCKPRLGPGEKSLIPVAPGPCAFKNIANNLLHKFNNHVKIDCLSSGCKHPIFILSVLFLFCVNTNVEAFPVFETKIQFDVPCVDNCVSGINYFSSDSILNRYPWWLNSTPANVINVEWIPAQDFKYKAIEDVLYNFLGGSLEPGSIGSFYKYCSIVEIKTIQGRQYLDFWGKFDFFDKPAQQGDKLKAYIGNFYAGQYVVTESGWYVIRIYGDDPQTPYKDGAVPGDYITFEAIKIDTSKVYPVETSENLPIWTNQEDRIRVDINAVPEPSSIVLFGITALGCLIIKNRNV